MKKLLAIVFVFIGFVAKAQPPVFKITGNGLDTASYLFGTIHIIPKADYVLPDALKPAMKKCTNVVMEMNLEAAKEEAKKHAAEMMLPSSKTYQDLMTESQFAWFSSFLTDTLKKGKLMQMVYQKMKPSVLSGLLLNDAISKSESYDQNIDKMAQKSKKTIVGLESFEEQMGFLNSFTDEEFVKGIKPGFVNDFYKMVEIYKTGNLDSLQAFAESYDDMDFKEMEQKLIVNRNAAWMPKLEALMKNDASFIAVGALHLSGEHGLLKKLREQGYTVEEVK